jgi:molybdate transport system ATP-binding protein
MLLSFCEDLFVILQYKYVVFVFHSFTTTKQPNDGTNDRKKGTKTERNGKSKITTTTTSTTTTISLAMKRLVSQSVRRQRQRPTQQLQPWMMMMICSGHGSNVDATIAAAAVRNNSFFHLGRCCCCRRHHCSLSVTSSSTEDDISDNERTETETTLSSHPMSVPPLIGLFNAQLSYPWSKRFVTQPIHWQIYPPDWTLENSKRRPQQQPPPQQNRPRQGGYAIVGRNGSGKSLLGQALVASGRSSHQQDNNDNSNDNNNDNPFLVGGTMVTPSRGWHARAVAHVSFDSHQELLQERDEKTGQDWTAFKAIATAGGAPGKLNPAAQFLVVRFGLYPLLHRQVSTLSTGEIRKVLLIRALSQRPKLLVLDNSFDGLDVPSRDILKDIVSRTLRGFTQDILVQGVSSKATARTQIVLMTHRAEEIVDEIDTIAWLDTNGNGKKEEDPSVKSPCLNIVKRSSYSSSAIEDHSSSALQILHNALGMQVPATDSNGYPILDWDDSSLPSHEAVKSWWTFGQEDNNSDPWNVPDSTLVRANNLSIRRGDVTLLHDLDWTVQRGERWIVGGGNGAGKSTLSRLLANPEFHTTNEEGQHPKGQTPSLQILPYHDPHHPRSTVGWVSTESHLKQHQEKKLESMPTTVREFLLQQTQNASWEHVIEPVLSWLEILPTPSSSSSSSITSSLLDRPFHHLSQGQQKLLLIAAAVAKRPPLLVLDEPCQGLDLSARQRLLKVVERICSCTDLSLIYITHHLEEELIPSVSHALHLKDRKAVYLGSIDTYDPSNYYTKTN